MSALDDLIQEIADEDLRRRIEKEIATLKGTKKFGLVFEPQNPECTPLYDVPVKKKSLVALKVGKLDELYHVTKIVGDSVSCVRVSDGEEMTFNKDDLISVAQFGDAIYPYLQPLDTVCNAPDSSLWHALIEADNYHALQLLKYLYGGKVDCIYIDPPYNKGARDWKYNNDYVDASNEYRHSKWLAMMERRLKLAKDLLNPRDSVLIVTIDEHEYLHLGCLLEEIFRGANIQMISTLINHHGTSRFNEFSRVNEYIFFVMIGSYLIEPIDETGYIFQGAPAHWQTYRRSNPANVRTSRPSQFYPIYVERTTRKIVKIGEPLPHSIDRFSVEQLPNCDAVFPVRDDGTEMLWSLVPEQARKRLAKGYIRATKHTPNKPQKFVIQFLMSGTIDDIDSGKIIVKGYADDGSVLAENIIARKTMPRTQWDNQTHDARDYGTKILNQIIGNRFSFPKSLYMPGSVRWIV